MGKGHRRAHFICSGTEFLWKSPTEVRRAAIPEKPGPGDGGIGKGSFPVPRGLASGVDRLSGLGKAIRTISVKIGLSSSVKKPGTIFKTSG